MHGTCQGSAADPTRGSPSGLRVGRPASCHEWTMPPPWQLAVMPLQGPPMALGNMRGGGLPAQITSQPTCLYADLCVDARRNRLIAIKEERPNGDVINAINTLVAVDIQTGSETVLDAGYDFYASPALSADGSKLAWLSWRHPNMPWTANQLSAAEFDSGGALTNKSLVAGSDPQSIFQPQWSPDGRLYFISDRTDFWNLYRWNGSAVEPISCGTLSLAPRNGFSDCRPMPLPPPTR